MRIIIKKNEEIREAIQLKTFTDRFIDINLLKINDSVYNVNDYRENKPIF